MKYWPCTIVSFGPSAMSVPLNVGFDQQSGQTLSCKLRAPNLPPLVFFVFGC